MTRVVNAHMEKALRKISVEYGYDPRDFSCSASAAPGLFMPAPWRER